MDGGRELPDRPVRVHPTRRQLDRLCRALQCRDGQAWACRQDSCDLHPRRRRPFGQQRSAHQRRKPRLAHLPGVVAVRPCGRRARAPRRGHARAARQHRLLGRADLLQSSLLAGHGRVRRHVAHRRVHLGRRLQRHLVAASVAGRSRRGVSELDRSPSRVDQVQRRKPRVPRRVRRRRGHLLLRPGWLFGRLGLGLGLGLELGQLVRRRRRLCGPL
eukprot:Amastigsp_a175663_24.p4 type:complete len:216 gc:universal Amastigsp_a175663_24:1056-1703(+)